jgi:hypothetical protein
VCATLQYTIGNTASAPVLAVALFSVTFATDSVVPANRNVTIRDN